MKIYFADTIQREYLDHNKKFPILHHLESYFFIMTKNADLKKWSIFDNDSPPQP